MKPVFWRWQAIPHILKDLDGHLEQNIQVYIFCNPDYYKEIQRLIADGKLEEILGKRKK